MGKGYQQRDYDIVDYELFSLPAFEWRLFRGPEPRTLEPGQYFACIGAAQTFGCLCQKPFPAILSDRLGLPALNLGVAGVGPSYFVSRRKHLLPYANGARFVVVQVMSGRSENNSLFECKRSEILWRRSDGKKLAASLAYTELLQKRTPAEIDVIVEETRATWLRKMTRLMSLITVPKILFWFSVRRPEYVPGYDNARRLFGPFPHFINRAMIDAVRGQVDEYVEVVTSRGLPHPLFNRFTGQPATIRVRTDLGGSIKTHNDYYPSPEMHVDAADALESVCKRFDSSRQ
jgi:hypothetical protein